MTNKEVVIALYIVSTIYFIVTMVFFMEKGLANKRGIKMIKVNKNTKTIKVTYKGFNESNIHAMLDLGFEYVEYEKVLINKYIKERDIYYKDNKYYIVYETRFNKDGYEDFLLKEIIGGKYND